MKKQIFYILLLTSIFGFSQENRKVKADIDTTNIRIGEQFGYKIIVEDTLNVIISKLEDLVGLEIISEDKIDTIKNQLIKKYILTGFDSGAYYIPQQQIFIKNKLYLTDSLLINIATLVVDTTKQKMFPIKAIKGDTYRFDDARPYFWWILIGLAIVGVALYFVFRKKKIVKEKVVVPLTPPYEEAINKLHQLDKKLLWQNNKVKEYYSELTEIVRNYIERELEIPALESTTDELVKILIDSNNSESISTSKETIKKLKYLLTEADLVKFAKSKPLSGEIEMNRKDTEEIVNNLNPKPITENDKLE